MRPLPALAAFCALVLGGAAAAAPRCDVQMVVLGVAQDAGAPQIGHDGDPAWRDVRRHRRPTSLGVIEPRTGRRWLFEATPALTEQLHALDTQLGRPVDGPPDGIFLTHAHIGHYAGLIYLGTEAMAARDAPVYALPDMAAFLSRNAPWSQLVDQRQIRLMPLAAGATTRAGSLSVTPLPVPHRHEFTGAVGFRIAGPRRAVLFIPDIDSWDAWDAAGVRLEDELAKVDRAYIDGTFFADGELAGRDMRAVPHPRIVATMARLAGQPAAVRAKVRFIHLNHTNPALRIGSPQARQVRARGFGLAQEGESFCLG